LAIHSTNFVKHWDRMRPSKNLFEDFPETRQRCLMNEWIMADREHLGGSPRVRDTRISVALILESLAAGMTIADIVDAYPSLTEAAVRGALPELSQRKELQAA
jgi:uncharacterized protein (DUF433 family)